MKILKLCIVFLLMFCSCTKDLNIKFNKEKNSIINLEGSSIKDIIIRKIDASSGKVVCRMRHRRNLKGSASNEIFLFSENVGFTKHHDCSLENGYQYQVVIKKTGFSDTINFIGSILTNKNTHSVQK